MFGTWNLLHECEVQTSVGVLDDPVLSCTLEPDYQYLGLCLWLISAYSGTT